MSETAVLRVAPTEVDPAAVAARPLADERAILVAPPARRVVSLDVLRGLAIVLMVFSGMIPKTLPNWMDHGYQPHYKPGADGAWHSALAGGTEAVFDGRWKAMTWVDLVFPMFLFSMGAALPMAMGRRLDEGVSKLALLRTIVGRWLMLIVFAVLIHEANPPSFEGQDENARRLLALAGFVVVFLFYARWPASVPAGVQRSLRLGTGAALLLLATAYVTQQNAVAARTSRPGLLFNWGQSDTIILVLAHCYLVAAVVWLFTSRVGWLRLAIVAPFLLIAHYVAISPSTYPDWLWMGDWSTRAVMHTHGGDWTIGQLAQSPKRALDLALWFPPLTAAAATQPWLAKLVNFAPLWDFTWYKYAWLVFPGTLVGDWVRRWSAQTRPIADASPRDDVSAVSGTAVDPSIPTTQAIDAPLVISEPIRPYPATLVFALTVALTVAVCCGLRSYGFKTLGVGGPLGTPWAALTLGLPLLAGTAWLVLSRADATLWLLRRLCCSGAAVLVVGLALACLPWRDSHSGFFEGGVSKGPPSTLSYYWTSAGLCMLLLMGLLGVLDLRPSPRRRRLGLLEANGQNPLLVYFLAHVVINALFGITIFAAFHRAGEGEWWSHVQSLEGLNQTTRPWSGALWGAAKTLLMAGAVWLCTRRRIYWRA